MLKICKQLRTVWKYESDSVFAKKIPAMPLDEIFKITNKAADKIEKLAELQIAYEELKSENERLRNALTSILNDVGYHNPMRMTTEISDKVLEDAAGALHD